MQEAKDWSLVGVWNKSLEDQEEREYEPRDYLWASELGKSEIDIFLKMKGVQPTNPPNARSLRKFEAGNIWEWIIKVILKKADLMIDDQVRVLTTYEGLLPVSGKIDFLAGGKPDFEKALVEIKALDLPPNIEKSADNILAYLKENYPEGLHTKALEVKSVSSFVMNALEVTNRPLEIHGLQAYHYTKHPDVDRANVIYVCRDDCRMMDFIIMGDSELWEEKYVEFITKMTHYYKNDQTPPKADFITFDASVGKFSLNRLVGWSPYLTLVYEFEDQMEFENKYKSLPASWNRVLKRVKTAQMRQEWLDYNSMTEDDVQEEKIEGTRKKRQFVIGEEKKYLPDEIQSGYNMTDKNKEAIAEMAEHGWDVQECAKQFVMSLSEEEENNE